MTLRLGETNVKVLAGEDVRPAPGAEVGLGYRRDRVHFFDQTGTRTGL